MDREERRERIASELFVLAVRDEHLLRVDRGQDGKGEQLEFKEKMVEAIADACVQATDKLISALEREPVTSSRTSGTPSAGRIPSGA